MQGCMTGIQRVVSELTIRFIKNNTNVRILYYSKAINKFFILNNNVFIDNYLKDNRLERLLRNKKMFKINKFNKNDILIDYDSVWDLNCCDREVLYKTLKSKGVIIVSFFHDLLPINNFEFFENYEINFPFYLFSSIKYSDYILFSTNAIKNEFIQLINDFEIRKNLSVVKLGSDLDKKEIVAPSDNVKKLSKSKYILCVATLEPRKNHSTLIKAYIESYKQIDANLILAGRLGWIYEDIIKLINTSKLLNKRIFIFNNASNDDINYLYKNAYLFTYPSFAEGYGLPIIEAMYHNCPVICSDIPVFKEITKNKMFYFNPYDYKELSQSIIKLCNNHHLYEHAKEIISDFKIDSWDDSYNSFIKIINKIKREQNIK